MCVLFLPWLLCGPLGDDCPDLSLDAPSVKRESREEQKKAKLDQAKLDALADFTAFDKAKQRGSMTTRKGVTRDYLNHLSAEHWARVDNVFAERMGDLKPFAHLNQYMNHLS